MEQHKQPTLFSSIRSISANEESEPALWKECLYHKHDNRKWKESPIQFRPLAGIFALLIALCCLFASLGILLLSNGQAVESWPIQPSVYLAIIAALTNSGLHIGRAQALPIAWWNSAFQGSTIRDLDQQWEVGNSVLLAIYYGFRYVSKASFASFALAIVIVDGVLLQRASTIGQGVQTTDLSFDITVAPEVPVGFSGYFFQDAFIPSPGALKVCTEWMHKDPITMPLLNCDGVCSTAITGPGILETNRTTKTWPITREMLQSPNASWGTWKGFDVSYGVKEYSLPIFEINVETMHKPGLPGGAQLTIGRANYFNLSGDYIQTTSTLVPAIIEYDISVTGTSVAIKDRRGVVGVANNTEGVTLAEIQTHEVPGTLETLIQFLNMLIHTNASSSIPVHTKPGMIWQPTTSTMTAESAQHANFSNGPLDLNFFDPTTNILSDFDELMFRSGIATANWQNLTNLIDPGLSPKQTIYAQQSTTRNVFNSDLRWWAGAAAFDLLTILIILPMFNHFWTHDRHRTFSPFEVALAFDSPLLKDVHSTAGACGTIRQLGDVKIRFGAVEGGEETSPNDGKVTLDGAVIPGDEGEHNLARRLGIERTEKVVRPPMNVRFAE